VELSFSKRKYPVLESTYAIFFGFLLFWFALAGCHFLTATYSRTTESLIIGSEASTSINWSPWCFKHWKDAEPMAETVFLQVSSKTFPIC